MEPRRGKETCEIISAQMKIPNDLSSSRTTLDIYSTHKENTTKKIHSQSFSHEEDIGVTNRQTSNEPNGDIWPLIKALRPDQKDLTHETTWHTIIIQYRNAANWSHPNWSSDEGVIQITNWVISNLPDLDICTLIEGFTPNHEELSYEPTCSGILVHQRIRENWNQTKIGYGWKDIQFLNQGNLHLPYLESLTITLQQLYSLKFGHDLKLYYINQNVPRHSTFPSKLSRLKHNSHFLILADSLFMTPTASFRLICDFFSILDFRNVLLSTYISSITLSL